MAFQTQRTEKLEKLIQRILPKESQLVKIYTARNNQSFYCLLAYKSNYFKVMRISDHATRGRHLDAPTFIWRNNPQFFEQLTTYIQADNTWFKVKYNEYAVLFYLLRSKKLGMRFCLERMLGVDYHGFYVDVFSGRNNHERKTLPEDFQKILKKFYFRSVVNVYRKNQYQQVYITSIGMALLNYMEGVYPQWTKDKHLLNYHQFELPDPDAAPISVSLKDQQKEKVKTSEITWSDLKQQGLRVLKECRTWLLMLGLLIKEKLPSNERLTPREEILLFDDPPIEKPAVNQTKKSKGSKVTQSDVLKESVQQRTHTAMDALLDEGTLSALKALKDETKE